MARSNGCDERRRARQVLHRSHEVDDRLRGEAGDRRAPHVLDGADAALQGFAQAGRLPPEVPGPRLLVGQEPDSVAFES